MYNRSQLDYWQVDICEIAAEFRENVSVVFQAKELQEGIQCTAPIG